ncbi:MAG: ligase-associated DNA damage response endonuclease PdeM [Acetobacteraceae bacterium]|nr:ligase-associated DNA damage response endonuclease PdeM [Acetobacteraceae bacterium]MCX7684682.1 ligase-associated DNA damage response endonuclease PdeM [Acetobacteraceae bacterium]MDW8398284.1 ligase-associated DNA damage response endonuclease PdeM [Acetobacteraceae bacterium]
MIAPLHLAGERLGLCPSGVALWPARRTLIAADLHLEKGSAFAARGAPIPPYDSRETIRRLSLALRRHDPARVILLGDSFHDRGAAARLPAEERAALARLLAPRETVWILGNHDPAPPEGLPGHAAERLEDGPFRFVHIADPQARPGEISGHYHPKATLLTRAGPITRPAFLADAKRLILPAFGAYAGGLDASDPALARLFPRGGRAFLIGAERLYSVPLSAGRRAAPSPAA